jgi:hypothetical protein
MITEVFANGLVHWLDVQYSTPRISEHYRLEYSDSSCKRSLWGITCPNSWKWQRGKAAARTLLGIEQPQDLLSRITTTEALRHHSERDCQDRRIYH